MSQTDAQKLEALYNEMGIPPEERVSFSEQSTQSPQPTQSQQPGQAPAQNIPDISFGATVGPYLPDLGELSGTIAGAYTGAQAGRVLGVPGMAGGMIVGALTGRGGGEAVKQMIEGSSDPIKVLDEALTAGAFAAGFEAIGPVLSMAKGSISKLRTGKSLSDEEFLAIKELQQKLQQFGITLTPAQLTQSGFQKTLEKVAMSGFGGEAPIRSLYEAQEEFIAQSLKESVEKTGSSVRQLTGEQFQGVLNEAEEQLISWARPKYAELDKLGRTTPINIQSTEQTLKNAIAKAKVGRKTGSTLDPEVEQMYQYVLGTKRNTDFSTVFNTISRLSSDLRNLKGRTTSPNKKYEKALRDTIELLHQDLAKAAEKGGNKELLDQYKQVSEVYRNTMKTLDDSALSGLATEAPEFVGSTIYRNGNVTMVQKAFNAVDEAYAVAQRAGKTGDELPNVEQIKNNIRAGYLESLFKKVQTQDTSVATASKLLRDLAEDPLMRDTFNTILTNKQKNEIKRVLRWADVLETQSAGNFSLVVRGRQSGALNQIINAGAGAGAVTGFTVSDPFVLGMSMGLVVGPYALAKRAVSGKATNQALAQMKELTAKFADGKMTKSDVATFFGIMAQTALPDQPAPKEFGVINMTEQEFYRMHQLQNELPD